MDLSINLLQKSIYSETEKNMQNNLYLDLSYIPRYLSSGIKTFAEGESHVSRYNRNNILILVFDGELHFEEDGEEIILCAGEYYVQTVGRWQTGNTPSVTPRYCFINFSGQFTDRTERAMVLRGKFDVARAEEACVQLCETYKNLSAREDATSLFEVQKLFFDVLNILCRANVAFAEKKSLAERIYAYISENFSLDVTLDSLAERFSYSKDHIIRVFKSVYKITPHQYLLQCRVCYAKILLSAERLSISEIASECGFADTSSFHRAFSGLEGVSPSQYKADKK